MTTIWQRAEQLLKNDLNAIETFFTGDVWPAIKHFFTQTVEEEVQALLPILESALPTVLADAGDLFSPAGWVKIGADLAKVVLPQLEATGKQVAAASFHAAVGSVLAAAKAATQPETPATAPQ